MKLSDLLAILRSLVPEHLAEPWDKVGLHVGDPDQTVRLGLLCIDLTESVMAEAVNRRAQLILAYHPPIFEPLTQLAQATWKQRVIAEAVQQAVAVYCPHTALDAAEGGVNDWLAAGVGVGKVRPIRPARQDARSNVKLVTFVPPEHADRLRTALSRAGAGRIGNYDGCSFSIPGEGTFRGGEGANPVVGRRGCFERVAELRMEMLVPRARLTEAVAALREVHPYEEPAFDLYPLEADPSLSAQSPQGQGRLVTLERPVTLTALATRVRRHLGVKRLEVAPGRRIKAIRRVALCAGAGGSLLAEAGEIDAFLTGEMRHHDVLDAVQRGVSVILAGHTQTERPYLAVYRRRLQAVVGQAVQWRISRADHAPTDR